MFKELESSRFNLRRIRSEDQDFIFRGLSDPEVIRYYGVWYSSLEETAAQMKFYQDCLENNTGYHWLIVDKSNNEPAGVAGINGYIAQHEKAEIGYWLVPEFWGKGVMAEVLPIIISFLFKNWKLHRLEAVIETGNAASAGLSARLGFRLEGVMRESEIKNGKRISLEMHSLLATEYSDSSDLNKSTKS